MTGVDTDRGMLEIARRRTDAQLLQCDAHGLALPDDTFDLAVAVTLLEFADRATEVIDELARVTRPGGRIAVAALNPRSPWGLVHRRKLRRPPGHMRACGRPASSAICSQASDNPGARQRSTLPGRCLGSNGSARCSNAPVDSCPGSAPSRSPWSTCLGGPPGGDHPAMAGSRPADHT